MVKFYFLSSDGYVEIGSVSIVDGKIIVSDGSDIVNKIVSKLLPWNKDPNLLLDELVRRNRGTYLKAMKVEDAK